MRKRIVLGAVAAAVALGATSCKIAVPDGTIPGKTGCEIWWLEPHAPGAGGGGLSPGDIFFLGSLVPLPVCAGDFPST